MIKSKQKKMKKEEKMKKILLAAYSLDIGGIETALLTLIQHLEKQEKYDITLLLEKKEGIFLEQLSNHVKVIEYTPNNNKNKIIRKAINMIKRLKFIQKYRNQFDFSIDYATYSFACSFVTRVASKNNALWVHNNYLDFYNRDVEKYKQFFNQIKASKFKNIIFVSKFDKNNFEAYFPELKNKLKVFNNLINYQKIIKKAQEKIDRNEPKEITLINIGRHDEKQKRLTRIIEVAEKLKEENIRCKIVFVGEGADTQNYKNRVKEKQLEKYIEFLGAKKNPYPYLAMSDALIMSSDYEGNPVVFIEAKILGKPIITTNISDSEEEIAGKYGLVTGKNTEELYIAIKQFIKEGYEIKEPFNPEKYNQQILEELEKVLEGKEERCQK